MAGEGSGTDGELPPYAELFPKTVCISAVRELSAWTSVQDIAAAARCLAGAPAPTDLFDYRLIIPFPDDDAFEGISIETFGWLVEAYRVPAPKLAVAAEIEPCLNVERREILRAVRFKPTISAGPAGHITDIAPALHDHVRDRFFLVEAEPYVIELVQSPLRCLMEVLTKCHETASKLDRIRRDSMATSGGAPSILHRPYADSMMPAILEALCFYAHGLGFGPRWSEPGNGSIDMAYRAVNLLARPPVDTALLDVARDATANMLGSLA